MNSSTKAELQQGREAQWFFLHDWVCFFCQCLLMDSPGRIGVPPTDLTFGHRRHKAFPQDITLHHIDENRENNCRSNLAWAHESCHRSHHAKKRALVIKTRKEVISQRYAEREKEIDEEKESRDAEVLTTRGGLHGR